MSWSSVNCFLAHQNSKFGQFFEAFGSPKSISKTPWLVSPFNYPNNIRQIACRKISKLLSLTAPLEEVSDRQRRVDVTWNG